MERMTMVRLGVVFGAAVLLACGSEKATAFVNADVRDAGNGPPRVEAPTDAAASPPVDRGPMPKSCTKYEYHPDEDGDGVGHYVKDEPPIIACPEDAPKGYGPTNADCADHDPRAHWNQQAYFTTPVQGPTISTPWDFNCNGHDEKESLPQGGQWVKQAMNCGETGTWKNPDGGVIETRTLACQ